jgi:transcription elongation factor GreB
MTDISAPSSAMRADADEPDGPAPHPAKNYITPDGFARLSEELRHLLRVERPKVTEIVSWAAGNGDRSENGDYLYGKKRLREIDRRIRFLSKRLESATVVHPEQQTNRSQVFFGASVVYARADDSRHCVLIVGVDEIAFGPNRISWVSPLAKALLKAREGDVVTVQAPAGAEEIEIISIAYAPIADSVQNPADCS